MDGHLSGPRRPATRARCGLAGVRVRATVRRCSQVSASKAAVRDVVRSTATSTSRTSSPDLVPTERQLVVAGRARTGSRAWRRGCRRPRGPAARRRPHASSSSLADRPLRIERRARRGGRRGGRGQLGRRSADSSPDSRRAPRRRRTPAGASVARRRRLGRGVAAVRGGIGDSGLLERRLARWPRRRRLLPLSNVVAEASSDGARRSSSSPPPRPLATTTPSRPTTTTAAAAVSHRRVRRARSERDDGRRR